MGYKGVRAVLQSCKIFHLIVSYQDGVPRDLQLRMREKYQTIITSFDSSLQRLPPSFRTVKCFPDRVIEMAGGPNGLCVQTNFLDHRNAMFPLHLAIAEGEFRVVQKFYKHKPELFSPRALCCALNFERYEIALWLCQILKEKNIEITNGKAIASQFEIDKMYDDDRNKKVEWYLCMDSLGFPIPFKSGAILETSEVEAHIKSINSYREALEANNVNDFAEALRGIKSSTHLYGAIEFIISSGKIEFVDIALKQISKALVTNSNIPLQIAKTGNSNLMEWFGEHFGWFEILRDGITVKSLIQSGHHASLRWIKSHLQSKWSDLNIHTPVKVVDVSMMHFLHEIGFPLDQIWPLSVEVARSILNHNVEITGRHIYWAVGGEDDDAGQYRKNLAQICQLYHTYCPNLEFTAKDILLGIKLGAPEFVQFLQVNGIDGLNESHMETAIQFGHFEMVQYMHEILGWSFSSSSLSIAIRSSGRMGEVDHKKLALVQYLVGCNKNMVWRIKSEPSCCVFETIQWLVVNCKGSEKWTLFSSCVRFGSVDVLEFIFKRTFPSTLEIESALLIAIHTQSMNLLEYLWHLAVFTWHMNGHNIPNKCDLWLRNIKVEECGDYSGQLWHSFMNQICFTKSQYIREMQAIQQHKSLNVQQNSDY